MVRHPADYHRLATTTRENPKPQFSPQIQLLGVSDFSRMRVAAARNGHRWLEICHVLERDMATATGIKPNLDLPTGPAYHLMGFDIGCFTTLFVMSRITGWTAHIMEQTAANALIRPLSEYAGPLQRPLVITRRSPLSRATARRGRFGDSADGAMATGPGGRDGGWLLDNVERGSSGVPLATVGTPTGSNARLREKILFRQSAQLYCGVAERRGRRW